MSKNPDKLKKEILEEENIVKSPCGFCWLKGSFMDKILEGLGECDEKNRLVGSNVFYLLRGLDI